MSGLPIMILAGGRASRMGGGDKALHLLGGTPILSRVIARMAPQGGPLALNANGDPARFAGFGLPVLADPVPDLPGPLAGVLAAMDWAAGLGAARVVTVPADTPFLPVDLVARLEQVACPVAMAASEEDVPVVHPICALWPVSARAALRDALQDGQRRVRAFAADQGMALAVFGPARPDAFFNVNRPEDLAEAEALL